MIARGATIVTARHITLGQMSNLVTVASLSTLLASSMLGQAAQGRQAAAPERNSPVLEQEVTRFDLADGDLVDGLAELSRSPGVQLHLGIEEILRERFATARERGVPFSLHVEHKKVRDVLDALCNSDARYTWSTDGASINVYPRARAGGNGDLLNFRIERIDISDIPDPDQALTPLSRLFPGEQVGYMQLGGDNTYTAPWTATFENLTVREFINRIAEHVGPSTSWIWQGGKEGRAFTFIRGGFHSRQ